MAMPADFRYREVFLNSLTEDLCAAVMFNGSNRLNGTVFDPMAEFIDGLIKSEKA